MFENVLFQSASKLLSNDIANGNLPGSVLFSGPYASGKLSCALELARVLSCQKCGSWQCKCPNCLQNKALVSPNVLLVGSGNRTLEIRAAKDTLLYQNVNNSIHLDSARYLYLRAVRKLTLRFSPVLWEGDDKLSKFSPLLQSINEELEKINPGRIIPDGDELQKILDAVEKHCEKLESTYLYDSLPVQQIRNFSTWARLSSSNGKKVIVIENADCMAESARNALLKILEEPPENTVFVLTTANRGAMLPTILSRVRTYTFFTRTKEQQQTVISRLFYYSNASLKTNLPDSIVAFLQNYLPVKPELVKTQAKLYFDTITGGHVPDIPAVMAECRGFSPRILFTLFLQEIVTVQSYLCRSPAGAECSAKIVEKLRLANNNVTVFNQNPASALEQLTRDFMQINHLNGGVFRIGNE
ncbi:MAG: DNA polymerase III [Treponema sp.]|nr:DNA polymerase III [Treponema sp.]